jgi:tetratricopeptide (TPR) repeat protein
VNNLEYIDNYFSGGSSSALKNEFEKKVHDDPSFAEEVAFYLSTMQAAKEQSQKANKERFKEVYAQYNKKNSIVAEKSLVRKLWPYLAAAAVITAIVIGWYAWMNPVSPQQLADRYANEHFQNLSVSMSSKQDSLQEGLRLYNAGKPEQALIQFENMIRNDSSSVQAIKYAGIASFQLRNYDKALKYFEELENYPGLKVNPGKIYHAITLMKRAQQGDKEKAKELLNEVVQNNLEEKTKAREWLKIF